MYVFMVGSSCLSIGQAECVLNENDKKSKCSFFSMSFLGGSRNAMLALASRVSLQKSLPAMISLFGCRDFFFKFFCDAMFFFNHPWI